MKNQPIFFTPDNSDLITFNERSTAHMREVAGSDNNGFLDGDIPAKNSLYGGHGYIYITGVVQQDAKVVGRQGMFSAKAIDADVVIDGWYLCVIGSEADKAAIIQASQKHGAPAILLVPERLRINIFDNLAANNIRGETLPDCGVYQDVPVKSLVALRNAFPKIPLALYRYGEEIALPAARDTERRR